MQPVASSLFKAAQSYVKIKAEKDQLQGNNFMLYPNHVDNVKEQNEYVEHVSKHPK